MIAINLEENSFVETALINPSELAIKSLENQSRLNSKEFHSNKRQAHGRVELRSAKDKKLERKYTHSHCVSEAVANVRKIAKYILATSYLHMGKRQRIYRSQTCQFIVVYQQQTVATWVVIAIIELLIQNSQQCHFIVFFYVNKKKHMWSIFLSNY